MDSGILLLTVGIELAPEGGVQNDGELVDGALGAETRGVRHRTQGVNGGARLQASRNQPCWQYEYS